MAISSVEVRAALGALVGGVLWAAKSLGILIADYEPEYAFAVAPFFFGVAAMGIAAKVDLASPHARTVTSVLAFVTMLAGAPTAWTRLSRPSGSFPFRPAAW